MNRPDKLLSEQRSQAPSDSLLSDLAAETASGFEPPARTGFLAMDVALPARPEPPRPLAKAPIHRFAAGQLVLGRFRIARFIAHGGMGEVYEAEDTSLGETVALKTVLPQIAQNERMAKLFKREIRLARKVTHENVCRIFDAFEAENGTLFLTMELLEGETLNARLRRQGPMREQEALPVVRQMCEALAAAHRAGIVHRDFKSGNVVLVASEEGLRGVVTDFGLAQSSAAGKDAMTSLTGDNRVVGTPAYMAPEQVEGKDATAAVDVYALGVVLYEMVTGHLPFQAHTPLQTMSMRLYLPAPSPRLHAPQLDPRWDEVILRCLEREPQKRFRSAMEVIQALEGQPQPSPEVETRRMVRLRTRRWSVAAALVAALLLGAGLLFPLLRHSGPGSVVMRRSVAVLGFKNLSGRQDTEWVSTALAEMLGTELSSGGKLRVVSGENVARMKVELGLAMANSLAQDTLARVGQYLGADLVVLGSYLDLGERTQGAVRLDLRVQDTAEGQTLESIAESGTEADLAGLVSRAGARAREILDIGARSAAESEHMLAAMPKSPEAARFYAQGLERLRHFDALAARDLLERAVLADPDNPLIRSALAQAWSELGFDARAHEEAKRAFELSGKLSSEERLLVEGRYHRAAKDWAKAIHVYQTLFTFFPDNLEYGLALAKAHTDADRYDDGLATVEALRQLPAPLSEDPRIDLTAGWLTDEPQKAHAAAQSALRKAEARGARLVANQARQLDAETLGDEDPEKAINAFEQIRQTWAEFGNRHSEAEVIWLVSRLRFRQGRLAESRKAVEESLRIHRSIGNKLGEAMALRYLGRLAGAEGRLAEAGALIEQSLALCREVGNRFEEGWALYNLAKVLLGQGRLADAREAFENTIALYRELVNRGNVGFVTRNLGDVLYEQGELAQAQAHYQEAWDVAQKLQDPDKQHVGTIVFSLGKVFMTQGDLEGARKKLEEALGLFKEVEAMASEAETRLALGELELEAARPTEAEAQLREALEEFREEKLEHFEAAAHALLARALLARNALAEGQAEIGRALALSGPSEYFAIRLGVAIAAARVRGASGEPRDAAKVIEALERALSEASTAGFVGLQFEARLALGEIELRSGLGEAGRTRLGALEQDASARGFGLILRKAAALRRP